MEPHFLFPAIAIALLGVVWGSTFNLIRVERAGAEQSARASSRELAQTYEAQVVRALREIDQTLKFVKYAYELRDKDVVLQELKARALLPPELLFVVAIADREGDVVASTRLSAKANVADQDYFEVQRQSDVLGVGLPARRPQSAEWTLRFSRRLDTADGGFAGIVMLSVDAAYFVSGYETSKLGEHGVLGILGTDGVFRARRSGDSISAGDRVKYSQVVPLPDQWTSAATPATNPWDGVRRYTSAQQLYEFPLAVILGLSVDEQLADTNADVRTYLWRAVAGSLVLIVFVAALGRTSWQLALTRQHAIEEQIAHARRVEDLAYHDSLTTLPNRNLFSTLLGQSITQAHRYERQLAVLFIDLDGFKRINDTFGHEAGDRLLQEIATRLRDCLRDSDIVARLGGDEFVAMLPEVVEQDYVATVARKILSEVAEACAVPGRESRVTASVGISIYPHDGVDERTLTKNADIAMYRAKEQGKNQFQFYSGKLTAGSLKRLELASGLRQALQRDEFELHYQARRDMRSGRITGLEALLRWQHPDLGLLAPMQFIPVAEETGLIIAIGKWVLRTACKQNVTWIEQGLPRLPIAVNLSARQFVHESLMPDLEAILAESGMPANLLELEISESLLMSDVTNALRILSQLQAMGIRLTLTDFGVGYASLATLKRFPLDTIKIDRSLICDLAGGAKDTALTEAIIAMGRSLSLTVVAQGVETEAQATRLRQHACDEIQGFYAHKPVPAEQIAALLQGQFDAALAATHAVT